MKESTSTFSRDDIFSIENETTAQSWIQTRRRFDRVAASKGSFYAEEEALAAMRMPDENDY
jgi:hypothetical protein